MKSIIEEASSIAKAIENGWVRAGKPLEFTVRIFEEPEKGFLGMTKKPAKIGLFYKEIPEPTSAKPKEFKRQEKPTRIAQQQPQARPLAQQPRRERPVVQAPQASPTRPSRPALEQPEQKMPKWTSEMVEGSKQWISRMMDIMGQGSIPFTIEQKNYYLSIRFANHVLPDKRKESILFKHWSYLLLQAMRHKFKRGLRGFKVVITSPA